MNALLRDALIPSRGLNVFPPPPMSGKEDFQADLEQVPVPDALMAERPNLLNRR
jgi:hypothetical protein